MGFGMLDGIWGGMLKTSNYPSDVLSALPSHGKIQKLPIDTKTKTLKTILASFRTVY